MAMSEKDRLEMVVAARKGSDAEKFLRGEFWKDVLGPIFAEVQSIGDSELRWEPGDRGQAATVDKVAMSTAYYSGLEKGPAEVIIRLQRLVRDGADASRLLAQEEKNK